MLFVRDKGQMGNNILQYGHAYAWAREHGRKTVSMRFAYKYQYFKLCKSRWHNFFVYAAAKYLAKLHLLPVLSFDTTVPYEDIDKALQKSGNAIVEGWGVRFYDLFLKYRQEIVEMFSFLPKVESSVDASINKDETIRIGIHVRRGDYKRHLGGIYFYEDETYISTIKKALSAISANGGKIGLYICGNDPTLNRTYYKEAFPKCNVHFPCGNPGEDLCLLSKMDFLIGPPSTFSLVASMYKDTPIYFIKDKAAPVEFKHFADYFVYDDDRQQQ